ncbi:metal-independent alpha-mannosidase [Paenibacillus sp. FSL H8-0548]|uniref:glycoside hydrolase family 125 protein n=1 Tax=Paenibacillus sp. FSL H8-0548 TaxID=1920422 RepID=UPI00096F63B9|nr:glycoside hydrolase family 125 protein [Paenibacillus sp. FSL H8-0548]OMF37679.1 metal-independent alpha-mannosidase [Paenibacillus sp. FSL H8-0548]
MLGDEPKRAAIFETCVANTWETTLKRLDDGTTFVITGDIPAMWLRDSAAQIRPYLLIAGENSEVRDVIAGLVERQFQLVITDPYANAFNEGPTGLGHTEDLTEMRPWVWERKYEVDSLCYPIQLSYLLWKNTGRTSHFSAAFREGLSLILKLWRTEQYHETQSEYRFQRMNCPATDTLIRDGKGSETGYTGMTWSGFRPSDDACTYGYLIPSNMFAVVVLRYVVEIATEVLNDTELAKEAMDLSNEIDAGIQQYGIIEHPEFGLIYAYETDGMGNYNLMDDANVPSLLSSAYLGYCSMDDPIYVNTRKFILSSNNPFYFKGAAAAGVGSPHTPSDYIWPIALAMEGLTSESNNERKTILKLLESTDNGCGMMHEGFHKDDPSLYTREWFSWANMMYCELVLRTLDLQVKG